MVVGCSKAPIREETKSNQSQGAETSVKPGEEERMRSSSVQITPISLYPFCTPKRRQRENWKDHQRGFGLKLHFPSGRRNLRTLPSQSHTAIVGRNGEVGTSQTSLRIRNGKSWRHESEEGCMGTPEIGEGRADMHSDFLGLLPALSLPPVHSVRTHGFSPSKHAGPRPAGGSSASGTGDPTRLLLTCGSMSSSVPHAPGEHSGRGHRAGAPGTRVLSPARDTKHARSGLRWLPPRCHTRHF